MQEVSGSIPLGSTKFIQHFIVIQKIRVPDRFAYRGRYHFRVLDFDRRAEKDWWNFFARLQQLS